jgi:hypothetical protein
MNLPKMRAFPWRRLQSKYLPTLGSTGWVQSPMPRHGGPQCSTPRGISWWRTGSYAISSKGGGKPCVILRSWSNAAGTSSFQASRRASKVARELGWRPITELISEIHEGDPSSQCDIRLLLRWMMLLLCRILFAWGESPNLTPPKTRFSVTLPPIFIQQRLESGQ